MLEEFEGKHSIQQDVPLFFTMEQEHQQATRRQEVFRFTGKDTLVEHSVFLLSDEQNKPLLFYSDILTPVCIDNICKPMYIELYWNLLGNYVGYDVVEEEPLTKYDHELFEEADYKKLHELLLDKHSILERKSLTDLFNNEVEAAQKVTYKGQEVDGFTGATKKEIKGSVVEGALYSCYAAWHLVHGVVAQKMDSVLQRIYSTRLEKYMLYSDYEDYRFYALQQLDTDQFARHTDQLFTIFKTGKPIVRSYWLKKVPLSLFASEDGTNALYEDLESFDINSRTTLLHKLPEVNETAANLIAQQVALLSRNQLHIYLNFLEADTALQTPVVIEALGEIVAAETYAYAYLVESFLNKQN